MTMRLSDAEAILYRTGPNNITILFETSAAFDPALVLRGLHQMVEGADRFHRTISGFFTPSFGAAQSLDWSRHVSVLDAPGLSAAAMMTMTRRLTLPPYLPHWRAVIANPNGIGWSGLALHLDHAIADGTRISRHITRRCLPEIGRGLPIDGLPVVSLEMLQSQADPRLIPAHSGLVRLKFAALAQCVPEASGHADALLRLARRMLDADAAFAQLGRKRRDRATVARIESLRSGNGVLGNRARMVDIDLSMAGGTSQALFEGKRTPWFERVRLATARAIPVNVLRPMVQSEFSRPGIVMTVVPGARQLPRLFGLDLTSIHPAAPVLGRPPLAVTALRTGDGFDVCITAHGPKGENIPGLSKRIARDMLAMV